MITLFFFVVTLCTAPPLVGMNLTDNVNFHQKLYQIAMSGDLQDIDRVIMHASIHSFFYDNSMEPARGDTVLHALAMQGTTKSRQLLLRLLKEGFEVNHTSSVFGHTALHVAVNSLDPLTTELLLDYDADPKAKIADFSTLDLALWQAIGAPTGFGEPTTENILLSIRSPRLATLSSEARTSQARQVVMLLMTRMSKSRIQHFWANKGTASYEHTVANAVQHQLETTAFLCLTRTSKYGLDTVIQKATELDALCRYETVERNFEDSVSKHIKKELQKLEAVRIVHAVLTAPQYSPPNVRDCRHKDETDKYFH